MSRKKHPIEDHPLFGWPLTDERFWDWWDEENPDRWTQGQDMMEFWVMASGGITRDLTLLVKDLDTGRRIGAITNFIDHLIEEGREDEIPKPPGSVHTSGGEETYEG